MSVLGLVILAFVPVIAIFVFAFTNRSTKHKLKELKGWKVADDSTNDRKQNMHDCYYSTGDDLSREEQVCKLGFEKDDDSS